MTSLLQQLRPISFVRSMTKNTLTNYKAKKKVIKTLFAESGIQYDERRRVCYSPEAINANILCFKGNNVMYKRLMHYLMENANFADNSPECEQKNL